MPASFLTLARGTQVVDRLGHAVGTVHRVLVAEGTHFDGLVVKTRSGLRFVDAPEVRRVSSAEVHDVIDVDALELRVESVHKARQLSEVDRVLEDIL